MRPGIVHRLDAGSSGLLVVARTQDAADFLIEPVRRPQRDTPSTTRWCGGCPRPPTASSTHRSVGAGAIRSGWRSSPTDGRRVPTTRWSGRTRRRRRSPGWSVGSRPDGRIRSASTCRRSTIRCWVTRPTASANRTSASTRPFLHAAQLQFDHPGHRRARDLPQPARRPTSRPGWTQPKSEGGSARTRACGERRPGSLAAADVGDGRQRVAVEVFAHVRRRPGPRSPSSTHWPSWSQAPSWCGWPKSPSVIGPSTADTISDSRISAAGRCEDVAAADAALGAHEPGALERQQDLLEVRLGQAGAFRDVAHRGRTAARCAAPATAALGTRSRLGWRCARLHCRPRVARVRRLPLGESTRRESDRSGLLGPQRPRDRAGAARTGVVGRRRCPTGCPTPSRRPTRSCCSCSTDSAGISCRSIAELAADADVDAGAVDPHGGADDHGDGADFDHHRSDAGRARARSATGWCSAAR